MSVFGIISEFNPFHNGHKYLFDCARERGAEAIVCVMSGNAVQRGETAMLEKHTRARMALECGADLVLELPFPWCASSAESFAACGVRIAAEFCDALIFGSECADIAALQKAADISASDAFVSEYKNSLTGNSGSASQYFDILSRKTGMSYSSNDILGIEYIKAAKRMGLSIGMQTVRREGGAYASEDICVGGLQSASAVRALVSSGQISSLEDYMPSVCAELLKSEIENGRVGSFARLNEAVKLFFRLTPPERFASVAETDGGLEYGICKSAFECREGSLMEALRTKRYTDARLRRAILFCLTGVKKEDIKAAPEYTCLLGANSVGRELLAKKRKNADIAVLAKSADIPDTEGAARQAELSLRLDSLFAMTFSSEASVRDIVSASPIII